MRGKFSITLILLALFETTSTGLAQGTLNHHRAPAVPRQDAASQPKDLLPIKGAAWTGRYSISVDGLGTLAQNGAIQVDKPKGATVKAAYLIAAAVWSKPLPDGAVLLQSTPIKWDMKYTAADYPENGWADVTAVVAPIVDAAPSGLVDIAVSEPNSASVDGEILAVVFNDPNSRQNNTIILLFGGQAITGETFRINFAEPLKLSSAETKVHLGLGISYSQQNQTEKQYSVIEVNGKRLTTSAGGSDDGGLEDGSLLTAGGIGDDFLNPELPFALPTGDRSDDELYNLLPFVKDGDEVISVFTRNPSLDDNIFFAWIETSTPAAIGESIILTPPVAKLAAGARHTLTATLNNTLGEPIAFTDVTFEIVAGVNKGRKTTVASNANGIATWTYSSTVIGADSIQARFLSVLQNTTLSSNVAAVDWALKPDFILSVAPPRLVIFPGDQAHYSITVTPIGEFNAPVTLSLRGLENLAWASSSLSPRIITINQTSRLTIATLLKAPFGTHAFEVIGVADSLAHGAPAVLEIAPRRDSEVWPNPFTPNGDGFNDCVNFDFGGSSEPLTIEIFNFRGSKVAELHNEYRWFGKDDHGEDLPAGPYLYLVKIGSAVRAKGAITLAR
jgi:gliding motility-associated-like protein